MNITSLIQKEFEILFPSILNNGKVELTAEDIIDAPNSSIIEKLNHIKGAKGIIENELESLYDFIVLIDLSETSESFDENVNNEFDNYVQKYQGFISFKFLQIMYRVSHFYDEGWDKNELVHYYKDVLESEEDIVRLDDFFQRSNFLLPILLLDEPPVELISILEDAINSFPEKALLKFTLSRILLSHNKIKAALDMNLQFLDQIEADRIYNESSNSFEYYGDSITIEDFHISLSNIASLFYKNNEFEYALEYSDRCLKEFKLNSEDIYSFQILYLDAMIVRLQVFSKNKDINGFKKEFEILKSKITKEELQDEQFKEIVEFANGLKM